MAKEQIASAREEMRARLADQAEQQALASQDGADADEIMERIVAEIGEATTLEDVLGGGKTVPVEQVLDRALMLRGYALRDSQEYGGLFAVIDAVDLETGEEMVVSTGSELVLAQLYKIGQFNAYPVEVAFRQGGRAFRLTFSDRHSTVNVEG